jgi:tetratricopeptide (TPR) repeat protein
LRIPTSSCRHEDYESAARDFESARGVDPNYPLIDFLEAKLMLDTGEPGPAEKMLSRYLSLNPGHGSAWVLRGRAFIMMGKPDEAAKDFTSAIAISQRPSPEVYRLQILSLAARGSDHSVETLSAVNIGLERFPYEVSLLGLGVDIALSENQVEIARGYLEGLPEKLYSLPQWEIRAAAVECLAAEESIERSKCLGEAKLRLEHQIQQFMGQDDG